MISYNLLMEYYIASDSESYIGATLQYIDKCLDIDISEFKKSDLPPEWLQLIEKEAREMNLIKDNDNKHNFLELS